ncbi:MAG: hypothetical protein KGI00_02865 [Candidatus Micrarchaeota archaeon]|nr:hypothetical protein [Candidatus Micrarchaeota archaeon]
MAVNGWLYLFIGLVIILAITLLSWSNYILSTNSTTQAFSNIYAGITFSNCKFSTIYLPNSIAVNGIVTSSANFTGSAPLNFNSCEPNHIQYLTSLALPYLTTYFNQFLETYLAISATLMGLYSLVFVEFLKLFKDEIKKMRSSNGYNWLRYLVIFLMITPLILLFIGILHTLSVAGIYQGIYRAINTFLTTDNNTIIHSNWTQYITLAQQQEQNANIINGQNYVLNMKVGSAWLNSTGLYSYVVNLPVLINSSVRIYFKLSIYLIIINLILFWVYYLLFKKIE